jgi:carbamoyl-phosphate synthase large subunit
MRRPRVLVTGTGGAAGVAVIGALNDDEFDVFSADVDPHAAGLYLVEEDRRLPISEGGRDSYTELVYDLCERHRIDVLIPAVDCGLVLLASARLFFSEIGTEIVLASEETLRMCLDRWALHRRCRGEVRVPRSMLVNEDFNSSRIEMPVIVKPRMGGGSHGVELLEQRDELERIDRDGSLLVQESLPGAEYSLNTLARSDGRVVAVVPWTRSSFGSEIAINGNARRRAGLEAIGRQVAELIGLTSMANIKVKEDSNGEPALLGVDPGFAGMMPLMTVAGGLNMPRLCVDDALGDLALEGVASD